MIRIDFEDSTYTCPYCGHDQAFNEETYGNTRVGFSRNHVYEYEIPEKYEESSYKIHWFECSNKQCKKVCLTATNRINGKQFDILPESTFINFPDYIPNAIKEDYEEACIIADKSPKAAATLLRRCLQGMIRDFWGIKKDKLYDEIDELKDRVTPSQWKALDGLRKLGNIGAHMEQDVNLIVNVEPYEVTKLIKLIERMIGEWYINKHENEQLYNEIIEITEEKEEKRKG